MQDFYTNFVSPIEMWIWKSSEVARGLLLLTETISIVIGCWHISVQLGVARPMILQFVIMTYEIKGNYVMLVIYAFYTKVGVYIYVYSIPAIHHR